MICESDAAESERLRELLCNEFRIRTASSIGEALQQVQRGTFQAILLSLKLEDYPPELSITQAISVLQKIDPCLMVIVMAAEENFGQNDVLELEREIRSKRIFYYMIKPADEIELRKVISEAILHSNKIGKIH